MLSWKLSICLSSCFCYFFSLDLLDSFSRSGRNNFNMMSNDFNSSNYNLYGLSASFLESLGISGPLHNKVFVANVSICI